MPPTTTKDREETLAAAIRDGKIMPRELDAYRACFDRDPAGTTATLFGLVGSPRVVAAAAQANGMTTAERSVHRASRRRMGLASAVDDEVPWPPEVHSQPDEPGFPVTPHPQPEERVLPAPTKTAGGATLEVVAPGVVTYNGVHTRVSDRGTTQVFSWDGWLDVEMFEARGYVAFDSAVATREAAGRETRLGRLHRGEG